MRCYELWGVDVSCLLEVVRLISGQLSLLWVFEYTRALYTVVILYARGIMLTSTGFCGLLKLLRAGLSCEWHVLLVYFG